MLCFLSLRNYFAAGVAVAAAAAVSVVAAFAAVSVVA